jgi:hypothetical protein
MFHERPKSGCLLKAGEASVGMREFDARCIMHCQPAPYLARSCLVHSYLDRSCLKCSFLLSFLECSFLRKFPSVPSSSAPSSSAPSSSAPSSSAPSSSAPSSSAPSSSAPSLECPCLVYACLGRACLFHHRFLPNWAPWDAASNTFTTYCCSAAVQR